MDFLPGHTNNKRYRRRNNDTRLDLSCKPQERIGAHVFTSDVRKGYTCVEFLMHMYKFMTARAISGAGQ